MNSPQQTAEELEEKIKQVHQMLDEELLAGNNSQAWRTIRLAKYLLEDVQKERASLLADKEKVAKLEAELQYERNANYYNDYAKAKVENSELLKEKEMLSYVIKHHESFRNLVWDNGADSPEHLQVVIRLAITAAMNQPK